MYKDNRVTAIITAAGKGSRMGTSMPKQFLNLSGKTILERAIEPFEAASFVDDILVVTGQDFVSLCRELCACYKKVRAIVAGGKERQDSVNNALKQVESGYVLIHDGARPYITETVIQGFWKKLPKPVRQLLRYLPRIR